MFVEKRGKKIRDIHRSINKGSATNQTNTENDQQCTVEGNFGV